MFKFLKECMSPEKMISIQWLEEKEHLVRKNYCVIKSNKGKEYRGYSAYWMNTLPQEEPNAYVKTKLFNYWEIRVRDREILDQTTTTALEIEA